jgi:acyl-coenzyme A thioesterase PaaI-like protein
MVPLTPLHLRDRMTVVRPRRDNACVGCGLANPFSLRLSFLHDHADGTVRTWLRPDLRLQGAMGTTHGGMISLLLDETMGKALSAQGIKAPTARLAVNFRRPMMVGEEYEVSARIVSQEGRKKFVYGEIRAVADPDHVVADADALFIAITTPPPA